jgi:PPK2 family polyphosphate:nucleotide phosphotransferase
MSLTSRLRVEPGTRVTLTDKGAERTFGLTKEKTEEERDALADELADLQELLYAAGVHSLLVVLQGMDTSGKDGTVKHVMDPVNPSGVAVTAFKTPSEDELAHDFLWRVHAHVPARGKIGIFNRSHYEDVLVVRVHDLVPKAVWRKRYRQITDFERLLTETNTIVLKFFLHISRAEQEKRLIEREQEIEKAWKLSVGDWRERALWNDYTAAYEDAISKTSTAQAPWYVIPADKKWLRNHLVLSAIVEALRPYPEQWRERLREMGETAKAELAALREVKRPPLTGNP